MNIPFSTVFPEAVKAVREELLWAGVYDLFFNCKAICF